MRLRLSVLMFLLYAAPGAFLPLFTLRLQELGFTPIEMGWVCATQALAALVAPLAIGQVADRWYAAERCLTVCALLAGVLLWVLAELTTPLAVFGTCLAFWLVMVPTLTLGTALTFAHLPAPERNFGQVRMWGTVGWMVSAWMLGFWFTNPEWLCELVGRLRSETPRSQLADIFRLGGLLAFALSFYSLTLPHTPPQRHVATRLAPLAALHLFRRRSFAVYVACTFCVCLTIPFSAQVTPLFLEHLGVPRPWLSPTLTIAQTSEVVLLALLPLVLMRLGVRRTMLVGLTAWVLMFVVLTAGPPTWLVVSSLLLNGFCISCYLVAGQMFVNSRARGDIRVSVQGLLTLTTGLGMVVGNLLVGWVRRQVQGEFAPTFAVAALVTLLLVAAFFLGFVDDGAVVQPAMEASAGEPGEGLLVPAPTAEGRENG